MKFWLTLIDAKISHYNIRLTYKVWVEQEKHSYYLSSVVLSSNISTYSGALLGNKHT